MVSVLFLAFSLLAVPFCNSTLLKATTSVYGSADWIYSIAMTIICVSSVQCLRKCYQKQDKKKYAIYVLIVATIAYDLSSLTSFEIKPLTYVVQAIIIGIYFLYEKWIKNPL